MANYKVAISLTIHRQVVNENVKLFLLMLRGK